MHIEADLDPIHAQRLRALQDRLQKPLAEVLGVAIDAAFREKHIAIAFPQRDVHLFYENAPIHPPEAPNDSE